MALIPDAISSPILSGVSSMDGFNALVTAEIVDDQILVDAARLEALQKGILNMTLV